MNVAHLIRVADRGAGVSLPFPHPIPPDLEVVAVAHYYRLPLIAIVAMAHSERRDIRDSLDRLIADLPAGAVADGLSSLSSLSNPAKALRVERRVWVNAMRLLTDVFHHIQGVV